MEGAIRTGFCPWIADEAMLVEHVGGIGGGLTVQAEVPGCQLGQLYAVQRNRPVAARLPPRHIGDNGSTRLQGGFVQRKGAVRVEQPVAGPRE
jgi:hypothetical protein